MLLMKETVGNSMVCSQDARSLPACRGSFLPALKDAEVLSAEVPKY